MLPVGLLFACGHALPLAEEVLRSECRHG
jgi:hypothetical protein